MSRTKRRTDRKAPLFIVTDYKRMEFGNAWIRVSLEDKELIKSLHCWHGDKWNVSNPSKWYRNNEHKKNRMLAKGELNRYYKDEDYEVQIRNNARPDYWD